MLNVAIVKLEDALEEMRETAKKPDALRGGNLNGPRCLSIAITQAETALLWLRDIQR